MLPQIQAMIIKYTWIYSQSVSRAGIAGPFAINASLIGIKGMRLLQDFIGNALPEDIPFAPMSDEMLRFDEAILETASTTYSECAISLRPLLTHLANAADLPSSPYFDSEGNYLLKL